MPREARKFINPITQNTEQQSSTETPTSTETLPSTYTSTSTAIEAIHSGRKRGSQAFEKTHQRITLWIDTDLKHRFETLAYEQGKAKTTLLNEAIADLLKKHRNT